MYFKKENNSKKFGDCSRLGWGDVKGLKKRND